MPLSVVKLQEVDHELSSLPRTDATRQQYVVKYDSPLNARLVPVSVSSIIVVANVCDVDTCILYAVAVGYADQLSVAFYAYAC